MTTTGSFPIIIAIVATAGLCLGATALLRPAPATDLTPLVTELKALRADVQASAPARTATPATATAPAPATDAGVVTTPGAQSDADVLCAAIDLAQRRDDENITGYLLRMLRTVDQERYFLVMQSWATQMEPQRAILLLADDNDAVLDKRLYPVIKTLALGSARLDSYRLPTLVKLLRQTGGDDATAVVNTLLLRWLEGDRDRDDIDRNMARMLLSSGLPQGHLAVLRSMRGTNYSDQRESYWTSLSDLYTDVHPVPLLEWPNDRNGDSKLSEANKAALRDLEQFIHTNRTKLVWDDKTRRMVVSPGAAPLAVTPAAPATPATAPAAPAAAPTPKSDF